MDQQQELEKIKDDFIAGWGSLGSRWGINRTMSQISALMISSEVPLNTDQIMERLSASRGNVHSNIKELEDWGLIQTVIVKGERKDFYVHEKDPWIILCTIAKKRKEKEVDPAVRVLEGCIAESAKLKTDEAKKFNQRIKEFNEILEMGAQILNKIGRSDRSSVVKWFFKLIGKPST